VRLKVGSPRKRFKKKRRNCKNVSLKELLKGNLNKQIKSLQRIKLKRIKRRKGMQIRVKLGRNRETSGQRGTTALNLATRLTLRAL
jgi:hypothetical protein